MRLVSVETIVAIHESTMAEVGLPPQPLLSETLLAGAVHRMETRIHYAGEDDLFALTALLGVAIAKAHAFMDGNKRTAYQAMFVQLDANGYTVRDPDLTLARLVEAAAAGPPDTSHAVGAIAEYLRTHVGE